MIGYGLNQARAKIGTRDEPKPNRRKQMEMCLDSVKDNASESSLYCRPQNNSRTLIQCFVVVR